MRLERVVALYSRPQLNKQLARRLITEGAVAVNTVRVTDPGWQVFLGNGGVGAGAGAVAGVGAEPPRRCLDAVVVRGQPLPIPRLPSLFVMHKPAGVTGVLDKDKARKRLRQQASVPPPGAGGDAGAAAGAGAELGPATTLGELVPRQWFSNDLGCYGRLDKPTTGLALLGRDGGVGALLLHPEHHVSKTYLVHLAHNNPVEHGAGDGLVPDAAARFAAGLPLADGTVCEPAVLSISGSVGQCTCAVRRGGGEPCPAAPADSRCSGGGGGGGSGCTAYTLVRVTISEGKFHQVKRMLAQVGGHGVHKLHRERIGTLSLDAMGLPVGAMRPLTDEECHLVWQMLPKDRGKLPRGS